MERKIVFSKIIAYSDHTHLEVLFIAEPSHGLTDFDQHFVVCRQGRPKASFPCVAVEILIYVLDHQEEFLNRGLQPACPPSERNTALRMGILWADWHVVGGQEGFTFYEDRQRLTFLSSNVIRALNAFWQRQKAPEERQEELEADSAVDLRPIAKTEE